MSVSYNTVTVDATATLIIGADTGRRGSLITNNDATVTIYLGSDSSVLTTTGTPLPAGATLINSGDQEMFKGDIYGIATTGTVDCRYIIWSN
jgi:hypothetical protein